MPTFLADASYCTRGGNPARWSSSIEAEDVASALSSARRAVNARHRGATKIDIRVMLDEGAIEDSGSREIPYSPKHPTSAVELRVAIQILDENRLREVATTRMAANGFDTDPATHFDEPLGDLLFEALIGSNPDPISPLDMGIEIVGWTGHAAGRPQTNRASLTVAVGCDARPDARHQHDNSTLKQKGPAMTVIGHNHIRKVENFDKYGILAHPLPDREDRVFHPVKPDGFGPVTYASHDVRIARPTGVGSAGRLAILMHHGGGRHVLEFYESTLPIASALLALPEREQYAIAYTIFEQADECSAGTRADEAKRWAEAYVDGRIRKRRRGRARQVYVETPDEKALRRA